MWFWFKCEEHLKSLDNEKDELSFPNGVKAGLTAFATLISAGHSVKNITLKNPHLCEVFIGYQKGLLKQEPQVVGESLVRKHSTYFCV